MLIYGINNSINIIPFWIKNEVFIKILIKLQRYIKHKWTNKIANYYYEKKLPEIINYIKKLREGSFQNNIICDEILRPKVSIIASVYNKEKYLDSFIIFLT